jgi:hypothetical protein
MPKFGSVFELDLFAERRETQSLRVVQSNLTLKIKHDQTISNKSFKLKCGYKSM